MKKFTKRSLVQLIILMAMVLATPAKGFADQTHSASLIDENLVLPEKTEQSTTLWPNPASKSLTTPSGWGASWGVIFVGGGITKPSAYNPNADGAISFGMGLGNPITNLGVELAPVIWDVSKFDNFALDFKLHRYLGNAFSVAVGGENLFSNPVVNDAGQSYYIVLSHAFQNIRAKQPDISALHASFGVGSGRYGEKSPDDILAGRGRFGTYFFGSLAYEIAESTNVVVDWNGLNLAAGIGSAPIKNIPVGITIGLADITRNSGDRIRFIASIGYGYQF
jgi:hypothetical protein